jgi:hypothetical protein
MKSCIDNEIEAEKVRGEAEWRGGRKPREKIEIL